MSFFYKPRGLRASMILTSQPPIMRTVIAATLLISSQAFAQGKIDRVAWLAGCWEINSTTAQGAARRVVERWSAPSGGEMAGHSRSSINGVPRESEKLRIFFSGDTIVYEAIPSGQTLTLFKAATFTDREIVFANPEHDFPQRIVYTRVGADSLVARIEGDRAGRRQPVSYPFRKAECTPDTPTPVEIAREALAPFYKDLMSREAEHGAGTNAWYAHNAGDGFQFVAWVTPGNSPVAATKEQLARSVELQRASPAFAALRDRVFSATLERVLVRGDTIEALISVRKSWKSPDTAGRYGPAGEYHERVAEERRIDTWVRAAGQLKLKQAAVVSDEVRIDGKTISKSGVAVP